MKIFFNTILGICAIACALLLLFQGFLFPALGDALNVTLRISLGIFSQWLFLGIARRPAVKAIPTMLFLAVAFWGFFLLLTMPGWLGATFGGFMANYASFLMGCLFLLAMAWFLPRLWRLIRTIIRRNIKTKKG